MKKTKKVKIDSLGSGDVGHIYIVLGTNSEMDFLEFLDTGSVDVFNEAANLVLREDQQIENFMDEALSGCKYRAVFQLSKMWVPKTKN